MPTKPESTASRPGDPMRRDLLRGIGACVALSALGSATGCGGRDGGPPLKIALNPFCGYQFMHLAEKEGWLPADAVNLRHLRTAVEAVAMLERGEVDGAPLTLDEVLWLRDKGMPLVTVLVIDSSAGADVLLARRDIEQLADLRGRRIGVEASALGTVMLVKTLEAAGLARADVTVVPMTEDHVAAWDKGDLDAILTYPPSTATLEGRGLQPLFDSRSIPQLILDVLAVKPEVVQRQPDGLRTLIAGHFRALEEWRTHPIDTAYRLAPLLGVPVEDVRDVYVGLDLPDAVYNRHYLAAPAASLTSTATELGRILEADGLIRNPVRLEGLFVPDFLPGTAP